MPSILHHAIHLAWCKMGAGLIWSEKKEKYNFTCPKNHGCTSITSQFVADDNSFVLGLLCYRWLSFCSYESSLHMVFTWFCWLFAFFLSFFGLCLLVFFICLVLLMDGFPSLIFIYRVFFKLDPRYVWLLESYVGIWWMGMFHRCACIERKSSRSSKVSF